jgi:fructokinase
MIPIPLPDRAQASAADGDRILVVGESLIDIVDRGGELTRHVGGSPLNVAFGLGRLGIPTVFATEFGDDQDGDDIIGHLASAGVQVERTNAGVRRTSSARARIAADGSASYEFDLEWDFTLAPVVSDVIAVHIGSIGALRPPGADRVLALVEALPEDVLVTFDPNIRPALVPSREGTRLLVERYAARASVVKLSDEDAAWLYPDGGVPERILACGARLVAVTAGAEGSTLHADGATVHVPARSTRAVDTIGAGDAYMTGLIAAIVARLQVRRVLAETLQPADLASIGHMAAVAASITVSRAGAVPPTAAELERALRDTGPAAA